MKKIAIPVSNGALSPHFGHCEIFYIYEVENNKILNERTRRHGYYSRRYGAQGN